MKYLLIDTANMFFRARHVAFRASDPWEKVGYALHISMAAINKVAKKFGSQCVTLSIEAKRNEIGWEALFNSGREKSGHQA